MNTERHQHRGRNKVSEKSPISLARIAVQNFNDLQRTSRYINSSEPASKKIGRVLERSPRRVLPKLAAEDRQRWVSLDASSAQSVQRPMGEVNKLFQFDVPNAQRFRQRVSLDYQKLEQIVRKRQHQTQAASTQNKILNLVQQLQHKLPSVPRTQRALVTEMPQIAKSREMFRTQTMWNSNASQTLQEPPHVLIQRVGGSVLQGEPVPANFTYPETNMRLTCNYFGSNDYTRKKTISDIKETVIEERQTQKSSRIQKGGGRSTSPIMVIGQREANVLLTDSATEKSWPSKVNQDVMVQRKSATSKRSQDSKLADEVAETLVEVKVQTPDGCKAIKIDSTIDKSDTVDSLYKQLDMGQLDIASEGSGELLSLPGTNITAAKTTSVKPTITIEKPEPHRIQLSTHLFNGEYLLNSLNESNLTIIKSQRSSHYNVPQQILQDDTSLAHASLVQLNRNKKVQSKASKGRYQRSPRENATLSPVAQHQVSYFAGPQINQINLHVHFSNDGSGSKATVSNNEPCITINQDNLHPHQQNSAFKSLVQGGDIAKQVQANLAKLESDSNFAKSHNPLNDQASKHTLNQSSSKALQMNQQQQSGESPFDLRPLNKYSSVQANNINGHNGLQSRLERFTNQRDNTMRHQSSEELSQMKMETKPTAVLGVNLNSCQSSKGSEKAAGMGAVTKRSRKKSPPKMRASPVTSSINHRRSNHATRKNSQLNQSPQRRTTEVQAHVESPVDAAYLVDEAGDKQQAEQMINEILHRLTQQQKQETKLNITTQKSAQNEKNKNVTAIESKLEQRQTSTSPTVVHQTGLTKMSIVKQSKMRRRSKPKVSPSPVDPKNMSPGNPMTHNQLNLYKLMVQKFEEGKSTGGYIKGMHNLHKQLPFNHTITEGFSPNSIGKQKRQTTITHSGRYSLDGDDFTAAFNPKANMSRTIMADARSNPWASFNANEAGNVTRFNPNTTGFSMLTTHLDRISSVGSVTHKLKGLQADLSMRPFSLESKPEQVAQHIGQSTVLFKVNPVGEIGRFRPRQKRRQESFAARNTRLGNIATRTSIGITKGRMQINSLKSPSLAADTFSVDPTDSYQLSPAMMDSKTSGFEKHSMERELNDLEQAILPSTEEPATPMPISSRKTQKSPNDQVIYEEVTDDCNADLDDVESHVSGAVSTIASQQTTRIRELLGRSTLGPQVERVPLQSKLKMQTKKISQKINSTMRSQPARYDDAISPSKRESISSQNIMIERHHGAYESAHRQKLGFVSMDQSLLEKIKQIQSQQQRTVPRNKMPYKNGSPGQQVQSPHKFGPHKTVNQSKDSPKALVQQIILGSKIADRPIPNQKISENEVLEGHSIISLRQEQVWSIVRPQKQVERKAPVPITNINGVRQVGRQRVGVNKSHLVVVQTPDAIPHIQKHEEVKGCLEIKIIVPSQLLSPDVIRAINGKLDLQISLIYFDGGMDLNRIQRNICPKFIKKRVLFNPQGFAINNGVLGDQVLTKWNLYDHCFRGQVNLNDLNFTKRQYIIEIELLEPQTKSIYLLRYLTFNQMSQTTYSKIYITIMQHLASKKRPLHIFDGRASEVLDFTKEPALKHGMDTMNLLYDKLVLKDLASHALVKRSKLFVDCPPIRLRGIILESPKLKVQIKSLSEFISINDGSLVRNNKITGNDHSLRKEAGANSRFRTVSRETLHHSDSQYVAVPVTNHELQARNLNHHLGLGEIRDGERNSLMRSALSKTHTSSTMYFGGAGSPHEKSSSPMPKSFSRTLHQSPHESLKKSSEMQLNYDSAKKIITDDLQTNPSMQVKKITEHRQQAKTPTRKPLKDVQESKPPMINKQQFHIDPNLEKGIDCSFEALGSSEGRHSANASSPEESERSKMRKVKRLNRYSHSAVDVVEVGNAEVARRSTKNLHYGSNTSEQEDDQGLDGGFGTFGPNDRLQSIFTMNKKESDLQEQNGTGGQQLIVRGSSKEMMTMPLKSNFQKDHMRKKQKQSKPAEVNVDERREEKKETFKLPSKGILNGGRTVVQSNDYDQQLDLEQQTSLASSSVLQHHDAAITANFESFKSAQFGKVDIAIPNTPRGSASKKQRASNTKKEAMQKSIVNLKAEDVIKEAAETPRHGQSGLAAKKTRPRRSNLRHALADEKQKQSLQHKQQQQQQNSLTTTNLYIQKKELQQTTPRANAKPKRAIDYLAFKKELSQVDSEVVSIRRSSLASHGQVLNPKLPEMGGNFTLQKTQRVQDDRQQISFERVGKQIDIKIISSEQNLNDNNSSQGNSSSEAE